MVPLVTLLGTLAPLAQWSVADLADTACAFGHGGHDDLRTLTPESAERRQRHAARRVRGGPLRCGEAHEGQWLEVEALVARGTANANRLGPRLLRPWVLQPQSEPQLREYIARPTDPRCRAPQRT